MGYWTHTPRRKVSRSSSCPQGPAQVLGPGATAPVPPQSGPLAGPAGVCDVGPGGFTLLEEAAKRTAEAAFAAEAAAAAEAEAEERARQRRQHSGVPYSVRPGTTKASRGIRRLPGHAPTAMSSTAPLTGLLQRGSTAEPRRRQGTATLLVGERVRSIGSPALHTATVDAGCNTTHGFRGMSMHGKPTDGHQPPIPVTPPFARKHMQQAARESPQRATSSGAKQPVDRTLVPHESSEHQRKPSKSLGLGAIQPEGREQVLSQWDSPVDKQAVGGSSGKPYGDRSDSRPLDSRQTLRSRGTRQSGDSLPLTRSTGFAESHFGESENAPKLEWSSLSRKSRQAIKLWGTRGIGGRHCLMLLEHENTIDFLISPLDSDEVVMADLRGKAVLNALSGLRADARGSGDGGWLYGQVFAKSPVDVLQDALCAAQAAASPDGGEDVSLEELNLALRCMAMRAQSSGMLALVSGQEAHRQSDSSQPKSSEEYMRVQVWLELLRLHSEGTQLAACGDIAASLLDGLGPEGACGLSRSFGFGFGLGGGSAGEDAQRARERSRTSAAQIWDDGSVLGELRKKEADLRNESQKMSLDSLRAQNRSIEAYLMRLVRQRDDLRNISRLADECDSYLVLGLDGPAVTEEDVKRAYRTLARREHPDKAGTDNKERFQQIQQAYASVLRQRRSNAAAGAWPDGADEASAAASSAVDGSAASGAPPGARAAAREAARLAAEARVAAERAVNVAHSGFQLCRQGTELRTGKRCACRELCILTQRGTARLRSGSGALRAVQEAVCAVSDKALAALDEYGDWADTAIAGAGLRERAAIAANTGKSSGATADLLDKICEANDAALRKAERVASASSSVGSAEALSATRMLWKGLGRTASVARCACDEAIGAAIAAVELSCSLVALDREWQRERGREAAENSNVAQPAPDDDRERSSGADADRDGDEGRKAGDDGEDGNETAVAARKPSKQAVDAGGEGKDKESCQKDASAKYSEDKVRQDHVSLRVRNLRCLGGLNEEVLQLQQKLRVLLDPSRGTLLPAVSVAQKGGVFELVGQILQAALQDASYLSADIGSRPKEVLEYSFAFLVALEHSRDVALSSEVRTQVLKLAALVDTELLCQIVDGPFRRQLLALASGGRRRIATPAMPTSASAAQTMRMNGKLRAGSAAKRPAGAHFLAATCPSGFGDGEPTCHSVEEWENVVHVFCARVLRGLRKPAASPAADDAAASDHAGKAPPGPPPQGRPQSSATGGSSRGMCAAAA
eukprot:TRINITY_DN19323_c0_g3_i2.p1 TRINITY_DN19323_c0_g3~~TRINITY_DN19323_c0_g3_i2.p1  ORF type:complete len:1342 (+),score=287.07 TRINITY_DN19323_c0_g3_i2:255-4028(+)